MTDDDMIEVGWLSLGRLGVHGPQTRLDAAKAVLYLDADDERPLQVRLFVDAAALRVRPAESRTGTTKP